ncbi:hypothetical protein FSP39_015851 [Pinctada imbricata]|uniref:Death domain-containing protein n=1 Tax=Pinctada imbricata TaxID=66713 RepID=A0AA88YRI2_PINIB|nr:hypothetical protein FSP39_015851 [Pinctada imbricata]
MEYITIICTYYDSFKGYSAPPPKTKYNVDGTAIKIDKPGAFGKNTHINIKSSKNVQIGNNNVMVINQTSSSKKGRHGRSRHDSSSSSSSSDDERHASTAARGSTKPVVTPDHQDLLTSERLVGDQDVRTASKFMGKSWRRIGRALSVADPELEQIHMDYSREEGIQGVGYRVIQVWRQKAGREAKLGVLTSAICKVYPPEDVLHHFSK